MNDLIEIVEEYNREGFMVKRTINGVDVPVDSQRVTLNFRKVQSITQKRIMTRQEVEHFWGKDILK